MLPLKKKVSEKKYAIITFSDWTLWMGLQTKIWKILH